MLQGTMIPWVEHNTGRPGDEFDNVCKGIELWMDSTSPGPLCVTVGTNFSTLQNLRDCYPSLPLIGGAKLASSVPDLNDVHAWDSFAGICQEVVRATDCSICVIEGESALNDWYDEDYALDKRVVLDGLNGLPTGVQYWFWYGHKGPKGSRLWRTSGRFMNLLKACNQDVSVVGDRYAAPGLENDEERIANEARNLNVFGQDRIHEIAYVQAAVRGKWCIEDTEQACDLIGDLPGCRNQLIYTGTFYWPSFCCEARRWM